MTCQEEMEPDQWVKGPSEEVQASEENPEALMRGRAATVFVPNAESKYSTWSERLAIWSNARNAEAS